MASDVSLAVGDGARRMTYAELAQAREISMASARRLVRRHAWARQVGNDGVIRIIVPLGQVRTGPRTTPATDRETLQFNGPRLAEAMDQRDKAYAGGKLAQGQAQCKRAGAKIPQERPEQSGSAGVKIRRQMAFVGQRQGLGDEERGALCSGSFCGSD